MNIETQLLSLMKYVETRDYAGYDPYDALNSPLLRILTSRSKYGRIAATQLLKNLPVNIRPILGIKKGYNPKAIGLFLWGYSKLYSIEKKQEYIERVKYLLIILDKLRCKEYSGNCWGYNFDWQSRTFFRTESTPTAVNSAFIGHALLDCYQFTGIQQALDMAVSIKDFILNDLNRTESGDSFCFSYTPVDTGIVHNANMLGASILIRLKQYCQDDRIESAALASMAYSMKYQHDDGSWYYAETPVQKWIDSFHTGFNLQAIRYFLSTGYTDTFSKAYEKGVRFYVNSFFLDDGTPKYYHERTYPLDIHAPAQAIVFLSGIPEYERLNHRIVTWMINNLYDPRGFFYFRKTRFITNKISYMRWAQAWAFHALTSYKAHGTDER